MWQLLQPGFKITIFVVHDSHDSHDKIFVVHDFLVIKLFFDAFFEVK